MYWNRKWDLRNPYVYQVKAQEEDGKGIVIDIGEKPRYCGIIAAKEEASGKNKLGAWGTLLTVREVVVRTSPVWLRYVQCCGRRWAQRSWPKTSLVMRLKDSGLCFVGNGESSVVFRQGGPDQSKVLQRFYMLGWYGRSYTRMGLKTEIIKWNGGTLRLWAEAPSLKTLSR